MKNIIIVISVICLLGLGIYFYIQNKVATVDLSNSEKVIDQEIQTETQENEITTNPNQEEVIKNQEEIKINNNNKKTMQATFNTTKGTFTVELFGDLTPKTVANFVKLAQQGFYNDTKFHRVIEGFMNQAGDPLSKDDSLKSSWGTGGPGYKFEDEITASNKNDVGTLSMANAGPNTNGSQFFINVAANNFLDPKHTVFGKVTSGMEVVYDINKTPTDPSDKPLEPVIIKSITIK
ncbi:MAG: peptidylprolyl isomerase [Candidatus Paceibacterota bacterium]